MYRTFRPSRLHATYTRNRPAWAGRVYSVAGGKMNAPTVIFGADAEWKLDVSKPSWPQMRPSVLTFKEGFSATRDHSAIKAHIEHDLDQWRRGGKGSFRHKSPVMIAVETSQNPPLYQHLADIGRNDQHHSVMTVGYRLRAGDQSLTDDQSAFAGGTQTLGAAWLVPWFNGKAEHDITADVSSDRVRLSFAVFNDGEPPALSREEVRRALSATESLFSKAQTTTPEAGVSLTADEATASAIMTALLAITNSTPAAEHDSTAWGWGPNSKITNWRAPSIV